MKQLRRAIAATATVAALAAPGPIALLSVSTAYAPAAFADTAAGATDPQASEGISASSPAPDEPPPGESPAAGRVAAAASDAPAGTPAPADTSATAPAPPQSSSPAGTDGPTASPSPSQSTVADGPVPEPTGGPTPGQSPPDQGGEPSGHSNQTVPGDSWSPSHCTDFVPDDDLSVDVSGLPSKIVAGSGWHPFTFSVANLTGATLRRLYVQSFTEYAPGVNEQSSLQLDLAQLQFHDPVTGLWSDAFQDSYEDDTGRHPYRGTFVALVRDLRKGERVDLHLRVRVVPTAPAGAGFALSTAVYAGEGSSCNINGDTYRFTVLKAGSNPGKVDDALPTGEKPTAPARPQKGAQVVPFGGGLARTGTSEAVPIIGLVGALAVLVGAVMVFASRRRGMAYAQAAEAAEAAEAGAEQAAAPTAPDAAADVRDDTDTPPVDDGTDGSSDPPALAAEEEDAEGPAADSGTAPTDETDGPAEAGAAQDGVLEAAGEQEPAASGEPGASGEQKGPTGRDGTPGKADTP